jgi:hypothetical protein
MYFGAIYVVIYIMKMKYLDQIKHVVKLVVSNLSNTEVIAGVVLSVTVIAVTLSTSKVIMQNYQLEKSVKIAAQKVAIAEIELDTQKLKNQYYKTDAYLEIAARKQLSKGAEGDKLVIVPKSSIVDYLPKDTTAADTAAATPKKRSNIARWGLFITGNLDD